MKDRFGRPIVKLEKPLVLGKKTEDTYSLSVRFEASLDLADFYTYQSDEELYQYLSSFLMQYISSWYWCER